jgi:GR25 family glycosyltransferase involved in LPS biosynthesis
MIKELDRVGLPKNRFDAFTPDTFPQDRYDVMRRRTPGAIGCHMSQCGVMFTAGIKHQHALVMEDDLVFCDDFKERLTIIEEFLNKNEWDVFWFGGTYHKDPTWHKNQHPQDLKQCNCNLNRDWEPTDNPNIVRTYGAFSTHCYLVNKNSIEKILRLLDQNVHMSMGIDWLFILLQPQLKTFAFDPGCVKQMDNMSNIGNGMTYFSGFSKLGPHWFKERL